MKHKTRKKALSWLLSLALMLSLVPALGMTALALDQAQEKLYVAGVDIETAQTVAANTPGVVGTITSGTATLTHDSESNLVLTLNNFVYSGRGQYLYSGIFAGITLNRSNQKLTVNFSGTNSISVIKDDDNGTITSYTGMYGFHATSGSNVIFNGAEGATLALSTGDGAYGSGISASNFTVTGGTVKGSSESTTNGSVGIYASSISVTGGTLIGAGNSAIQASSLPDSGVDIVASESVDGTGKATCAKSDLSGKKYVEITASAPPMPHTHNDITFTAWSSADSLPSTAGSYYLTQDVTIGSTWNVPTGETNLCLNGHNITYTGNDGSVISVPQDAVLNLFDCGENQQQYSINNGLAQLSADGGKTFTGGYITGGSVRTGGGVSITGGTFSMYGGTIIGCTAQFGGGVFVNNSGAFNLIGGTITGCTAAGQFQHGGGVYVSGDDSSFTMSGGSISENSAQYGGGVNVNSGSFTMSGGSIDGNSASGYGGGVYLENKSASFTMSGGSINGNSASRSGGGVYRGDAKVTLSGDPRISDNTVGEGQTASNLDLNNGYTSAAIVIGGALDGTAKIRVTMQNPGVFTSGWAEKMGSADPADYFISESPGLTEYVVKRTAEGEARLAKQIDINVATAQHGTVTAQVGGVNATKAYQDETVTLNVTPDQGYRLKTLTVTSVKPEVTELADLVSLMGSAVFSGERDETLFTIKAENGNFVLTVGSNTYTTKEYTDFTVENGKVFYAVNPDDHTSEWIIRINSDGALSVSFYPYYLSGMPNGTMPEVTSDLTTVTEGSKYTFLMTPTAAQVVAEFESVHTRDFTYAADGATITATCSNTDGCTLTDSKATLTIVAPTLSTYGGTGNAAATLTGLSDFNTATGKAIATTEIKYVGRDGTSYDESTTAPTNAGKYTAKITVEGTTASVSYEIAKAPAGTPVVTMTDYTYGGEVPSPAIGSYSGESTVAYYYNSTNSTTGGTEWKNITSTTLAAGTYYMYAVIAETENYSGYTTATTSFTVAAPYSLYLGGTQVTSANAADVFGDGKASYNAESNTLTLNGYSNGEKFYKEAEAGVYEAEYRIAAGVYYAGAEKLTVALEGNNVLTMPEFSEDKLDNAAFFSKGSVEFTGTGSLTATGGKASDSSEDSNVGSYGLCAVGENAAFMGSGAVTFIAGSGESSYGAYFGKETAVAFSGGTVTMTGGTSTGGSYGMYCGRVEVTGGEVQVTGGEAGTNSLGIYCWKDISVSDGAVTAAGGSAADSSYGFFGESISVTGGEATFIGGTGVNYSEGAYCKKDVSVTRGSLTAVGGSAKYSYGLYSYDGYENKNGVTTYGVAVSNGKLTTAGGSATEKSCGLCLRCSAISVTGGEVEVTGGEAGKTSYGMDGGIYSVYARGGKLTAQGGTVTGDNGVSCGIYIGAAPFYIEGSATVNATGGQANVSGGESCGIRCMGLSMEGGEVTATGGVADDSFGVYIKSSLYVKSGTLTATGGNAKHSRGIYSDSLGVEVTGGTVAAVGGSGSEESCGVYLAARKYNDGTIGGGPLTISGGVVNVIGGSYGVFCDQNFEGKMIVITGGTATARGNIAISKPPILGADVSASASTELDGTPAEYNEEENNNYKFFTTVTAPGSKTPITSVSFTVEVPVVGAEPAEWVEITTEPEGALTTTAYRAVWVEVDEDYNYVPMTSSLFETGKQYAVLEPNEENAGAPLVALCAPGYVLPTVEEPVYTVNDEETMLFGYLGPFEPIGGAEFSVSVSPAELRFSAYTGYSEEDTSLYREITASNTGNGKVRFITAGFTESSMYEQFGLIVGDMTATVYPKEGLTQGTYTATVRIEDLYNRFDTIEVPVTFTVYTRSTAPRTPAVETVTVPVSGDDETVNVTVKVSGDTATITSADVDKVMKAEDVGTVTIDVSSLKQNVTEVSIPGAMVKKIADAVADESNNADGLEIKLPTGTVTFDAEAVAAIAEQANGKDLRLNLEDVGENRLNAAQKTAVDDMDVQEVLDAYMTVNGQRISDFKGGKAAVTVSYTLKDGQTGRGVVVWYVADDGDKSEVPTAYSSKEVTFTVEHFSNYVIAYDAARAAACPQDATCPVSKFVDADAKAWYHDGVHWALDNGVMEGASPKYFSPNGNTTRAMVATMLWRLEDSPVVSGEMKFVDVAEGTWYTEAIRWASDAGIITGSKIPAKTAPWPMGFRPNDAVTREQLATMLYRYGQYKKADVSASADLGSFNDAATVSSWATSATQWAVGSGIINGIDGNLVPAGKATRAQVATMLMRFHALFTAEV